MMALPSPKNSNNVASLETYYRQRITEMVDEQLKVFPFVFGLMDAPSEATLQDWTFKYWNCEDNIQKCRNALIQFRKG